jgi:hypothetical protein
MPVELAYDPLLQLGVCGMLGSVSTFHGGDGADFLAISRESESSIILLDISCRWLYRFHTEDAHDSSRLTKVLRQRKETGSVLLTKGNYVNKVLQSEVRWNIPKHKIWGPKPVQNAKPVSVILHSCAACRVTPLARST